MKLLTIDVNQLVQIDINLSKHRSFRLHNLDWKLLTWAICTCKTIRVTHGHLTHTQLRCTFVPYHLWSESVHLGCLCKTCCDKEIYNLLKAIRAVVMVCHDSCDWSGTHGKSPGEIIVDHLWICPRALDCWVFRHEITCHLGEVVKLLYIGLLIYYILHGMEFKELEHPPQSPANYSIANSWLS